MQSLFPGSIPPPKIRTRLKVWARFFSNPARVIVSSFALLIFLGTALLMLPISTRSGQGATLMEALFTSTSATCVTGLVVQDTFSYFTIFGQVVILFLIQFGGLGLVTFATFFNIALRKRVGLKSLHAAQESMSSDSMSDVRHLLKMIFAFTFVFEMAGALILMTVFLPQYGTGGIFISIFLAVSAYCNAGFDILGFQGSFSSVTNYADNPIVLGTIMALIICGGLGFIVWQDIYHLREHKHLTLHTKIVLTMTGILIVIGAIVLGASEWNNPHTLGHMGAGQKILNSMFMSVTARTAGFNAVPLENTFGLTKLFTVALMFIGAAPGSTGGGIKVTTAYVLIMTVVCVMQGKEDTIIGRKRVDKAVVYKAMAVFSIACIVVLISTGTIFFTSHKDGMIFTEIEALFESASAFGTVGLSCGVTAMVNTPSRLVLILTMFIGRVGPVSLALSLALQPQDKHTVMPEAKIMVG